MSTGLSICLTLFLVIANICFAAYFLKGRAHARVGNAASSTSQLLFGNGSFGNRLGRIASRIFHYEFFDCLFGSCFLGGICYGLCWWLSSEGAQHPVISALFFGTFAMPFAIPDMVDDLLEVWFGRHSTQAIILGGICCLAVFLLLALGFVTFFCATVSLATVGAVFAVVFAVMMLLYFSMAANGQF